MNREFERVVGQNIRKLREANDLTQERLSAQLQANDCDITRSALAKIEAGQRHIYLDELREFKKLLKTSYDELMSE
ncbi:MAG: helix-turn-helix transcriptional regulator [Bacillota bacterium]